MNQSIHHWLYIRYVVKSGLYFGVDFAVYLDIPSRCHSELCVLVVDATGGEGADRLPWRQVGAVTRVMPVRRVVCCRLLCSTD